MRDDDFEATLRDAAYDLGRDVQVIHRAGQAADHPVLANALGLCVAEGVGDRLDGEGR